MTDPEEPKPQPQSDDDALDDVESLGGDDEIMESLPAEGSPISGESDYDSFDAGGVFDDGEAHDYSTDAPQPLDERLVDADVTEADDYAVDADADGELDDEADTGDAYEPDAAYAVAEADTFATDAVDDALVGLATYGAADDSGYDFLDIDAALASVATLGDMEAEREQAEIAEQVAIEAAEQAQEEKRRPPRRVAAPPMLTMRRGQLASVVPALALIVFGGWLTFAVTAPDAVPVSPLTIILAAGATVLITLLALWVASGRWSRGVLFFTLLALLTAVALYYDSTLDLPYSMVGPLVLAAAGLAFALSGLLARPMDRRYLLPGMLLLAAAGVNVAVAIGYLPDWLLTGAAANWPVLVAVVAVLWLLPVLFKRRA